MSQSESAKLQGFRGPGSGADATIQTGERDEVEAEAVKWWPGGVGGTGGKEGEREGEKALAWNGRRTGAPSGERAGKKGRGKEWGGWE